MKLLVNTPALNLLGGVSSHYLGLRKFWTQKVCYNTVGRRGNLGGAVWLPWDIIKFLFRLLVFHPDVVLLNPSLGPRALRRDFIFLRLSRFFDFKTAVFIHGFDWDYAHSVDKKWVRNNFNRADLIFILAKAFESEMRAWGVIVPIVTTTTKVDNDLLAGFDVGQRNMGVKNILFVGRLVKEKAIYILVDAFKLLKEKYPHLRLTIVGDGEEFDNLQAYVGAHGVSDVTLTGRLSGEQLRQAYRDAQLFCFPTYHGEGFPTAVIEAMAFGLPVFTRRVGGLCDFFEDGKMGYITESVEPQDFANAMEVYIVHTERTRDVAVYNSSYARQHFMASGVAVDIENKLRKHLRMKILVNTPSLALLGGVANHYLGLRKFWTQRVRYNTIGRRGRVSGVVWLPWDIVKFVFRLLTMHPDVVLLNPSLGASALKRDFIFLSLARMMNFKVAVFIHGFNWNYTKLIDKEWARRNFNRAQLVFVLAKAFETEMRSWGVNTTIVNSTTKVDDALLRGYDVRKRDGVVNNIVFVARLVKAKGVYILIDSFRHLKTKHPHLRLTIVGDGEEYGKLQSYIHEQGISDVNMTGRLSGQELAQAYIDAQLFCFPSFGEGFPTAVLEAMAFGLPIFTRKVGGLCDFFEDGKMGFITDSFEPQEFADAMEAYVLDKEKTREVALYNAQYARRHFMASRVAVDIENKLRNHIFNL